MLRELVGKKERLESRRSMVRSGLKQGVSESSLSGCGWEGAGGGGGGGWAGEWREERQSSIPILFFRARCWQ